jgi:hypothetical protein
MQYPIKKDEFVLSFVSLFDLKNMNPKIIANKKNSVSDTKGVRSIVIIAAINHDIFL